MKMTRFLMGVCSIALVTMVISDAFGQDEQRRRGGFRGCRPGGGPGGPGGFGPPRGGDPVLGLLRVQEVRDEIELLPDQEEALRKLAEEANLRPDRGDFDFRNASEEERNQFFEKMRSEARQRAESLREKLEEVLLPEQFERLQQIALQVQGMRALMSDRVVGELGISDAQKEEMENVFGSMRDRMMEMFRSGDREGMREKMESMRDEIQNEAMAVLSDDQRKKFEAMKGEPFEMPEGMERRGGFDRGPGAGGGRFGGGPGGRRGPGGGGDRGRPRGRPDAE
jgi:hypothetical protein